MDGAIKPGQDGDHPTFCRLCEAYCGLVATVKNGRVTGIVGDKQNPHSQGHVCVKGVAIADVTYDPDRILTPLKRVGGPGRFVPVTWDEALDDIAARLGAILDAKGGDAFALYHGNPPGFATDFVMGAGKFLSALGAHKRYTAGSQDHHSRMAANYFAYGAADTNSFPDMVNCDLLLIFGANVLVSNGSLVFSPRIRHDLDAIAARGRVIVVDPRRTETAKRYEHLPIKPAGDAWFMLGMLRVLVDENLVDQQVIAERTEGWADLEKHILTVDLAAASLQCGVPEHTIREIALAFATTPRAAAYGRLGLCRGPHGSFTNFLLTILNVVAGKFGKRGGTIFGYTSMAGMEEGTVRGYAETRSRVGNLPAIGGVLPSAVMPADLLDEGEGRVRALFVVGGNPMLSAPGGAKLEEALQSLELMVSCDIYLNETHQYADYILPGLTFLERPDLPLYGLLSLMRPFLQYTDAVIPPVGDARDEFDILADIARRMGKDIDSQGRPLAGIDHQIRKGPAGDDFSARDGWSFERLLQHRHGVMVDLPDPTVDWERKIGYPDRKFRLWHPLLEEEFQKLLAELPAPQPQLRLIGRRDIRSMNSWMHNVDRLVRSQTPILQVHPEDATARGIEEGDSVRLSSKYGEVYMDANLSRDVMPGVVCYPHGWGHDGRGNWRIANAKGGKNINVLMGLGAETVETLAGMTIMDGLEVWIEKAIPA